MDVTSEGEVKGIDDCRQWNDSDIGVVGGGVDLVVAEKGVSGSEFGARENLPDYVKVL